MRRASRVGRACVLSAIVMMTGCSGSDDEAVPTTAAGPQAEEPAATWHPVASSLVAFSTESTSTVFSGLSLAPSVQFSVDGVVDHEAEGATLVEPSLWSVQTPAGPTNVLDRIGEAAVSSGAGVVVGCDEVTAELAPLDGSEQVWIAPEPAQGCDGWFGVTLDVVDGAISRVDLATR